MVNWLGVMRYRATYMVLINAKLHWQIFKSILIVLAKPFWNSHNFLSLTPFSQLCLSTIWSHGQEIQKKCKITLVRNLFWPFLNKSCWKAALSTANFWKTKQKWQRAGKNPPVAGQGLTRSQNSCRIEFSSKNGWEISSSVFGTTRWPQL